MSKRVFWLLAILIVSGLVGCRAHAVVPAAEQATARPTASPTVDSNAEDYLSLFESVWQTVNENHFETDFGGVDWQAAHDRYRPLVAAAPDDEALYGLLNEMLWELKVSHAFVGPVATWKSVEPVLWQAGTSGLAVRLLQGQAVITRVETGSAAERAGLRPGLVLERVDGVAVAQILQQAEVRLPPPYNERSRVDVLTRNLLARLYGPPGTCVPVVWRDQDGVRHERCLLRMERARVATRPGVPLPPTYLEVEARRLEGEIGYLRFNTFHPALMADLAAVVQSLHDTRGLIVDLRGNPGGSLAAVEGLVGQFLTEPATLGRLATRSGTVPWLVRPGDEPYAGPLVVLLDPLSFSGSEWFASGLQAVDRAVVVGVQTAGGLTGANVERLSNGALLMYPVVQLLTPAGEVQEGHGVQPDVVVELDRDLLLQGIDAQLEAAIAVIEGQGAD